MDKNTILDEITSFYLESRDFNGIPSTELSRRLGIGFKEYCDLLRELISEKRVGILFSPPFGNPHIIQIGFDPEDNQIERLNNLENELCCLYPRPAHLKKVVNRSEYANEPYKLELALGCPQLDFRSFDPSVLEQYRNDPRYIYQTDEIGGHFCYNTEQLEESAKTMLQSFGFSYDPNLNRAVAVFLRYLARLSPSHQQIWKAHQLKGDYELHPDYYLNAIRGDWREHESIFKAFLDELHLVCQLTQGMGRPPLFRKDFGKEPDDKPPEFGVLIRPTLKEFNSFVHELDKMISDNINKKFFQKEVPYVPKNERKDGTIEHLQKGTIQILDDWIRTFYSATDSERWDAAIGALKAVRKKRDKPAHVTEQNVFDSKYSDQQRELMMGVYKGMQTLRMILQNHPNAKSLDITVPDYLRRIKFAHSSNIQYALKMYSIGAVGYDCVPCPKHSFCNCYNRNRGCEDLS